MFLMEEQQKEVRSIRAPKRQKYSYVILGGGSIGLAVAKELAKLKKVFLIIDKDKSRVGALRDQNYEALEGDISTDKTLEELPLEGSDGIFILTSDYQANLKALRFVKEKSPRSFAMVRAIDLVTAEELYSNGADILLHPPSIVADKALTELQKIELRGAAWQLMTYLKSLGPESRIGIVVHDNPDPDSIASALALKNLAESVGKVAEILYFGTIGHQETRAFINLLSVPIRQINSGMLEEYNVLAMVDCNTPGRNNSLPPDTKINIIIDHHAPQESFDINVDFIDIRPDVGATSTIMTRYVQELDFEISSNLATALLYGIRTDTSEFKRNTSAVDMTSAAFLYAFAEQDVLAQIETPSMSAETMDVLGEAIRNKKIEGSYLISNVGFVHDRDTLPQAADHLLKLEGISTVLVFGMTEDKIHLSARSKDIRVNIGDIISRAFSDIGSAGGHQRTAAAQIPLGIFMGVKDKNLLLKLADEAVRRRFLTAVGVDEEPA
ncbi:putative phosphoesterase [Methanocella arvoryzae MRE50]|uniref:Phosphoesterase n=2 Tax=Methanocella TaxID=570266 RepID=Q0W4X0_METAR|nr:putative phosphoesterase [Methanocella arvoryzae MRE50]